MNPTTFLCNQNLSQILNNWIVSEGNLYIPLPLEYRVKVMDYIVVTVVLTTSAKTKNHRGINTDCLIVPTPKTRKHTVL